MTTLGGGGTERFFLNLINNLSSDLFDISLVLIKNRGEYFDLLRKDIEVIELKCYKAKLFPLKLNGVLKEKKPDLVMTGLVNNNILMGLTCARWFKEIKFIARESIVLSEVLKGFLGKIKGWFIRRSYKSYSKIIVQSEDMYKDIYENFGVEVERLVKINNFVDTEKVSKFLEDEKPHEIDSSAKNILCVGRLNKQKRFCRVIEIFKDLKDENLKLNIIGDGPERKKIEEIISKNSLEDRVFLLGKKKNPYIYMKNSDLFILGSDYEGFPNVLVEAGVCGLYTVSNNCPGGINEIISEVNGRSVNFDQRKETIEAIEEALNLKRKSHEIRDYIVSRFSKEKIISEYTITFNGVIGD